MQTSLRPAAHVVTARFSRTSALSARHTDATVTPEQRLSSHLSICLPWSPRKRRPHAGTCSEGSTFDDFALIPHGHFTLQSFMSAGNRSTSSSAQTNWTRKSLTLFRSEDAGCRPYASGGDPFLWISVSGWRRVGSSRERLRPGFQCGKSTGCWPCTSHRGNREVTEPLMEIRLYSPEKLRWQG